MQTHPLIAATLAMPKTHKVVTTMEDGFWSGIYKFRACAPNRLFGVAICHGEAV